MGVRIPGSSTPRGRAPGPSPPALRALAVLLVLVLAGCASGHPGADTHGSGKDRIPVVFIGDSYTQGTPLGGSGPRRWTALVTSQLETEYPITPRTQAISGSGYVAEAGRRSFLEMVPIVVTPESRLVVVFGSRNDAGMRGLSARADETYRAIDAIAPDAELLVVGPTWVDAAVPVPIEVMRDTLQEAASKAGARFVDPITEGWFAEAEPGLIADDRVHPTDSGHEYLARRMLPHLRTALAELDIKR